MKMLDDYLTLQAQIFGYFGYVEDWRVIPIEDRRRYFWRLDGEGPGTVGYADSEQELADQDGNYYEDSIYTQRHLPKWVYRGPEFTLVCVDTHTDGNKFLAIFANANERPDGVTAASAADTHDSTGAMAAAWFGTPGAGAAIERVFGKDRDGVADGTDQTISRQTPMKENDGG